jgi:hypothetical protein
MKRVSVVLLALCVCGMAWADQLADAGRKLLAEYPTGVLTVELQLRQSITAGAQERKSEARVTTNGTLLDMGGLIAIPLSAVEPGRLQVMSNPAARGLKIDSEVAEAKIILTDSTEVPVEVVYRDNDLDLAFVRSKEALPGQVTPFGLKDSVAPQVMDEAFVMWRLGPIADRVLAIHTGRILATLSKPRPYYIYEHANVQTSLGCPVVTQDGKLLGLVLMRFDMGGGGRGAIPVVIPTEDIREAAQQAMDAMKNKPAEKSADPAPGAD